MQVIDSEKLRKRDEEALGQLFEQLYPRLRSFSAQLTLRTSPSGLDPDELTNETFLRIYKNLDSLLGRLPPGDVDIDSLTRLAKVIARNILIDHYRRQSASPVEVPRLSSFEIDQLEDAGQASEITPESEAISRELLEKLFDQISGSLSDLERIVFSDILAGEDLRATAAKTGQSVSYVYRVKSDLLHRLRRLATALQSKGTRR